MLAREGQLTPFQAPAKHCLRPIAGTPEALASARQVTPMVVDATSNGRFEKVTVPGFVARETGLSPKRQHLRNLQDPSRRQAS